MTLDDLTPVALVVLGDGPRTSGAYLAGETCLNQLAELARFLDKGTEIHLFFGHSADKWCGRGRATHKIR